MSDVKVGMALARFRQPALEPGVPIDGLILHYTMDNISGNTLVDEVGNHAGTIYGATPVNGVIDNGLSFDGQSDRVDIPSLSLGGKSEITISLWSYLKASSVSRDHPIIVGWNGDGWILWYDSETGAGPKYHRTLAFAVGVGTYQEMGRVNCPSDTALPQEWMHIVVVFKGGEYLKVYVNGEMVAENTSVVDFVQNSSAVPRIGDSDHPSSIQHGDVIVDQLRIYDRAVTEDEILLLYSEVAT